MPKNVLIWLPSPLGDAVMATPALRAFREVFKDVDITFMAPPFTRQILSPSPFCNNWVSLPSHFSETVNALKTGSFDTAVLLKNSFGSALAVRLAGIPRRIGYARDGRSFLLTDKIPPRRMYRGEFKPVPAIDYYLKIAEYLGGSIDNRKPELTVADDGVDSLRHKVPGIENTGGPLVIVVPGGAFGPSKLWPVEQYAQLADRLHNLYQATVILSVAPVKREIEIAERIGRQAESHPIHLGQTPLSGGELKALFKAADLVITNDTGPRHIAIALDKNVISLFGPNNPQWTQTGHTKEIQIIGKAPCVPCDKPRCRLNRNICMESITVEEVLLAAERFWGGAIR